MFLYNKGATVTDVNGAPISISDRVEFVASVGAKSAFSGIVTGINEAWTPPVEVMVDNDDDWARLPELFDSRNLRVVTEKKESGLTGEIDVGSTVEVGPYCDYDLDDYVAMRGTVIQYRKGVFAVELANGITIQGTLRDFILIDDFDKQSSKTANKSIQEIVDEYKQYEVEGTSYPEAPNSGMFRALVSGGISYFGGDTIKFGSGMSSEVFDRFIQELNDNDYNIIVGPYGSSYTEIKIANRKQSDMNDTFNIGDNVMADKDMTLPMFVSKGMMGVVVESDGILPNFVSAVKFNNGAMGDVAHSFLTKVSITKQSAVDKNGQELSVGDTVTNGVYTGKITNITNDQPITGYNGGVYGGEIKWSVEDSLAPFDSADMGYKLTKISVIKQSNFNIGDKVKVRWHTQGGYTDYMYNHQSDEGSVLEAYSDDSGRECIKVKVEGSNEVLDEYSDNFISAEPAEFGPKEWSEVESKVADDISGHSCYKCKHRQVDRVQEGGISYCELDSESFDENKYGNQCLSYEEKGIEREPEDAWGDLGGGNRQRNSGSPEEGD